MKKKLAIICASADQIPLVNKAKEMEIETHCFSWDKKNYTDCKGIADYFHPISILEKEQILEVCKDIKIDGVTSMIYDFAVPTVAYVAQGMGLPGNNYEDSLIPSNKFSMRQAFHRHGVNSPRFAIAGEGVDLTDFRYPLIVKPTDRCSSIGVTKVGKEEDLQEAIGRAQENSYREEAIIEEFISGIELSVDAISYHGKHYILVIKERELMSGVNCDIKVAGHYPIDLPSDILEKIKIETQKALNAIGYKYGASNTEFRVTKDGEVFILEVNPRMAGDYSHILMKLYNGYDVLKGVIDVALGQFEEPVFTENKYSGIYFLTKRSEWVRQYIENRENDTDIVQVELFNKESRDPQNNVDRMGYFIYQSDRKRRWETNLLVN